MQRTTSTATTLPLLLTLAPLLQLLLSSLPSFVTSQCNLSDDLSTSLQGDTGSFGNMFDLVAKNSPVRITQIDFYTDVQTNVTFHLWSKSGTYLGYETNPGAWTKHATGWTYGNGLGKTTPIPRRYLSPFEMAPGTRRAFVFVLEEPDVRYGVGTVEGDPWEESEHLVLTQGKGVLQFPPFPQNGTFYAPRVFNGKVTYEPLLACENNEIEQGNDDGSETNPKKTYNNENGSGGGTSTNIRYSPSSSSMVELKYRFAIDTHDVTNDYKQNTENVVREILNKSITDGLKSGQELITLSNMSLSDVVVSCNINPCRNIDIVVYVEYSASEKVSSEEIRYFLLLHAELIEETLSWYNNFVKFLGPRPVDTERILTLDEVSLDSFQDPETVFFFEKTVKHFLSQQLESVASIARVGITSRSRSSSDEKEGFSSKRRSSHGGVHIRQHSLASVNLGVTITGEYYYQPSLPDINFTEKIQESFENDDASTSILVEMLQENDPTGRDFQSLVTITSVTEDASSSSSPQEEEQVTYYEPSPRTETQTEAKPTDKSNDLQPTKKAAGENGWNNPTLIFIYLIPGVVFNAVLFAKWPWRKKDDDKNNRGDDADDSKDMSYSSSVYSALRRKVIRMGGSGYDDPHRCRSGSTATAPPVNIFVVQGGEGMTSGSKFLTNQSSWGGIKLANG